MNACFFNNGIIACEQKPFKTTVISSECNSLTGDFDISVLYRFIDTVSFRSNQFNLPDNWSAGITPVLDGVTYYPNDSVIVTISVVYPINNIPFFVQPIEIKNTIETTNTFIDITEITYSAMIYFTPYNTIEIWNLEDFHSLPRRWYYPHNSKSQNRIFIPKSNIPVSNINIIDTINWYDATTNWDTDNRDNFREVKIPGLAYSVLTSPIPIDSLEYYDNIGDGPDSISTKKTYTGTVKGRLTASLWNDIDNWVTIPLAGIKVYLKESDWVNNQTFGETYTNENGEFSFYYSESQIAENDYVELFLEFKSFTNSTYSIESSNGWGNRFEERTSEWSAPQNAGTMTKNIDLMNTINAEPFKAIHWARRGFQYFESQGVGLQKNLKVKPFSNSSQFGIYSFTPTIYLESGDGYRENSTFHEFGHFAEYRLQSNNSTPYYREGTSHSWSKENTSMLAWVEGWANAVQMILDAAYWEEDQEYALKNNLGPYFEVRRHNSWPTNWQINNGFRSEYNIACSIYDLWDGLNKNLPNTIPFNTDPNSSYFFTVHGWNDTGQGETGWRTEDNVELNFYQLCKPLKDHPTGSGGYAFNGQVRNVQDYYRYLINNMGSNCILKSDISRVFRENRVQWNIPEYEWGWHATNLSSDFIRETKQKTEYPTNPITASNWTDFYLVNFHNDENINEYQYSAWPSQDLLITDNLDLGIWDNTSNIFRQSNLYLNDAIRPDYSGMSLQHGHYQTCGDITVDIRNGKVELGGDNTTATFTVRQGATLHVREHGTIVINNNSTLIIECGANLIYDSGANIELNGENAQLILLGNLEIGNNAIFTFTGTGSLTKLGPSDIVIPYPNSTDSKFIVESGTRVTLVAKNSIRLRPGFHAKSGSYFRAYIDPSVPECENGTKSQTANTSENYASQLSDNIETDAIKWETKKDTVTKVNESRLTTRLIGNYPNPNSDYTVIKYKIGESCPTKIFITSSTGIKIKEILNNENHPTGEFEIVFNTKDLETGVYFYTLQTDKYFQTKRMIKQ